MNNELKEYLFKYRIGNILSKYPEDLQERAIKIIEEALELDKLEKGKTDIDEIMQKIFGICLIHLKEDNKLRRKY